MTNMCNEDCCKQVQCGCLCCYVGQSLISRCQHTPRNLFINNMRAFDDRIHIRLYVILCFTARPIVHDRVNNGFYDWSVNCCEFIDFCSYLLCDSNFGIIVGSHECSKIKYTHKSITESPHVNFFKVCHHKFF